MQFGRHNGQRRSATHRTFTVLLIGALASPTGVLSCRGGGGSREPNQPDIDAIQIALAASTTASAALSGKVVEPSTTLIGASTPGTINVEGNGAASYRVPIWVPDGINGLQPSLALQYDSSAPIGTLGPKWRVTGLSIIQRCAQHLAQDGIKRPVTFYGDTFCLDGQRLQRQNGTANQIGDFRTEVNPFQKISATAADAYGITTFQVYQPDGRIFYYGRTAASRLGFTTYNDPAHGIVATGNYAYYLDKIQDRFGNSILISYTSHVAGQELFPSSIAWGGTGDTSGQRVVTFQYQAASTYNPSLHQTRAAGVTILAGEHLQSIFVYGPDGLGGLATLKQYLLGYTTPSITGEQLLYSIQECDNASPPVCKRPTKITWEPGSYGYTRTDLTATQGITDLPMSNAPNVTDSGGHTVSLANVYRRVIPVDLNNDGRDDLVYRVYSGTCTNWVARLSTSSGTFGAPITLPGGADADTGCPGGANAGTSTYFPYTGDIFFADLDLNGYPDVISPHGHNQQRVTGSSQNLPVTASMNGYYVYYNTAGSPLAYNTTATAIDGATSAVTYPNIAIGDVNGDGYPDVVRPSNALTINGTLVWYSSKFPNTAQNTITEKGTLSTAASDFSAIDADGDGIAEVTRLLSNGQELVNSPTIQYNTSNQGGNMLAQPLSGRTPSMPEQLTVGVWNLDLNGDGVEDFAAMSNGYPETQINTAISFTGRSPTVPAAFPGYNLYANQTPTVPASAEIGLGWEDGMDDGVRVVDFNLDGRQDLVLMGNGANSSGATRSTIVVLLSDGLGGFTALNTSIPVGDPSDGGRAAYLSTMPYRVPAEHGYRTSVALDLNGDGLPDFVQIEGGHVVSYVRQGKMPDMVTQIVEGTGHQLNITSVPLSDTSTYTADSSCAASNPTYLGCLVSGPWLTKSVTDTTLETVGSSQAQTLTYTYTDGQLDRVGGRGFAGFARRDQFGPGTQHISWTFNPGLLSVGAGYMYSTAFLPATIRTDVDTNSSSDLHPHHYSTKTISYGNKWTSGTNNTSLTVLPNNIIDKSFDCSSGCTGTPRNLSWTNTSEGFDVYGNLTSRTVAHVDSTGATTDYQTDTITFNPADIANWLVRKLSQVKSVSSNYSETVTQTTSYVTDPTTQALSSIEQEPTGDTTMHWKRVFSRDARGRVYSVADQGGFPNYNGCTANCSTPTVTRTTGYLYEDADGVYVTTTTDALGHTTRDWRHPGYGFLVERDDQNHLAETWTYDTFGRQVGRTERSGQTTTMTYADSEDPMTVGGWDLSIVPDGTATAARTVHFDSKDRLVMRTSPVDSARTMTVWNQYDDRGHIGTTAIYTGTPAQNLTTQQNAYYNTYDDLNRLVSTCHTAADGAGSQCVTYTFDGLQKTKSDENGHTTVRTTDGVGRLVTQAAPGVADTTFRYGPFSRLEFEGMTDSSGQTTFGYDVRGRLVSTTRQNVASRVLTYNAFGEVVGSYKQEGTTGSPVDSLSYGRDGLGRLTSVTGSGMNRTFYWDHSFQGLFTDTNSIGKLVDVFDGLNKVHFQYDASGRLFYENWQLSLYGAPVKNFGDAFYFYDQYGRLQNLEYPANLPGNYTSFNLNYTYDPYVGDVSSLAMSGNTIWQATARNALGEITTEALRSWGGVAMSRTSSYYMPTGQLNTQTLSGSSTQAQETYDYWENGLPYSLAMSGVGGSWKESLSYDNLNRLTTWTPDLGAPAVTYQYDGDGNLTQRAWSGEAVNYSFAAYQRTATIVQNGVTVASDNYQVSAFGQMFSTPSASLTYNANDEVISAVEKANGNQIDTFVHDGLGERVATTYGTNPTGSYLVTLMGSRYELAYNGATGTYEERCRFLANGKVVGDQVKTASTAFATTTFYLADNVGSVLAEASNTGVVTARSRRDPYGNLLTSAATPYLGRELADTNPDGTSRYGFGDHDREANLGLVDMNARFYSPRLGAFTSADSVIGHASDRRDYNPFAYAWGNPVSLGDPTGHGLGEVGTSDGGSGDIGIDPYLDLLPPPGTGPNGLDSPAGMSGEGTTSGGDDADYGSSQLGNTTAPQSTSSAGVDSTNAPQSAGTSSLQPGTVFYGPNGSPQAYVDENGVIQDLRQVTYVIYGQSAPIGPDTTNSLLNNYQSSDGTRESVPPPPTPFSCRASCGSTGSLGKDVATLIQGAVEVAIKELGQKGPEMDVIDQMLNNVGFDPSDLGSDGAPPPHNFTSEDFGSVYISPTTIQHTFQDVPQPYVCPMGTTPAPPVSY